MPTILTHAMVPLTMALVAGPRRVPLKLALAGAALAMLPDVDVIGFHFGVAYASPWGHRGAVHSLAFAAIVVAIVGGLWREMRRGQALTFLFLSMASHGLLDTLTDGGQGVALLWPFDNARYFAPWRLIRVSPIGARFFTPRGLATLASEALYVWLPCFVLASAALARRALTRAPRRPGDTCG